MCLRRRKYCDNSHLNHHHTYHAHHRQDHHQHHCDYPLHGEDHHHPHRAPVFTVESYRSPNYLDDHNPLYEDIREIVNDKSDVTGDECEDKIDEKDIDEKERRKKIIESSLVYGTIVTKEVARYKPSTPIILRK